MATNPAIFGQHDRFEPYINEYRDVHKSVFDMIGMLILLFLAKLGINDQEAASNHSNSETNTAAITRSQNGVPPVTTGIEPNPSTPPVPGTGV